MNDYLAYRLKLKNEGKPPAVKKPYKIAQYSKKRQKGNREYAKSPGQYGKGKCVQSNHLDVPDLHPASII